MEPENHLFWRGKSSSKAPFLGSMLVFRGSTWITVLPAENPDRQSFQSSGSRSKPMRGPGARNQPKPWQKPGKSLVAFVQGDEKIIHEIFRNWTVNLLFTNQSVYIIECHKAFEKLKPALWRVRFQPTNYACGSRYLVVWVVSLDSDLEYWFSFRQWFVLYSTFLTIAMIWLKN